MPELPEVETVKNVLKKQLIGKTIFNINILYDGIIKTDVEEFKKKIIKEKFLNIERKGKWLIFELTNYYLVSHLRMEGKYFLKDTSSPILKHEHIIFLLDNKGTLRYQDTRKFGCMYLVNKDRLYIDTPLNKVGLEPFDKNLNINYLKEKFKGKRLPIKTLLLDQTIMSGLGNIYVDEVLVLSKINPLTKISFLNDRNYQDIINHSKEVLDKAIKYGGTTIRSYTSSLGVEGSYQKELVIHSQIECKICHSKVIKIKVGGRGTYYCPKCQPEMEGNKWE